MKGYKPSSSSFSVHVIYLHLLQTSQTLISWTILSLHQRKESWFAVHCAIYSVVGVKVLSILIALKNPMKQHDFKQTYIDLDVFCNCSCYVTSLPAPSSYAFLKLHHHHSSHCSHLQGTYNRSMVLLLKCHNSYFTVDLKIVGKIKFPVLHSPLILITV